MLSCCKLYLDNHLLFYLYKPDSKLAILTSLLVSYNAYINETLAGYLNTAYNSLERSAYT